MILQTDKRLRKEINEYGCYFMSIIFLANKYTGCRISTQYIVKVFDDCVELGFIKNDDEYKAFIVDAEAIFNYLGLKCEYNQRHDPPKYNCSGTEFEILCLKYDTFKHFVVGDGRGHIAFDPMGITKKGCFLHSKRIFKRV